MRIGGGDRVAFAKSGKIKNPAELPKEDRTAGPEQIRGRIELGAMLPLP
jgi:hypothetical protein